MKSHPQVQSQGLTTRGGRLLALFALALAATLAFSAAPASAAYTQVGQIGGSGPGEAGSGSEDGQLSNPNQADVNDASGVLYVADTGNDRVQAFTPSESGGDFSAKVAITAPTGLAIDQSDGSVYVANATGISKFDAGLNPVIVGWSDPGVTGTLAVDPSNGDLLVADQGAGLVRRYESDGTADGSFAAERPLDLAVDASGDVLVITSTDDLISCAGTSSLIRFDSTGTEEGPVGSLSAPGQVDVDPDSGEVLVAAPVNSYNCGGYPALVSFDSTGNQVGSFDLPGAEYGFVPGLAAQGGSPRVYAVVRSPLNDSFVTTRVAALNQIHPPQVTLEPITTFTGTEAELDGTVDANGLATEYRFELSKDGGNNWDSLGTESAGEGNDPVEVEATATSLDPNTAYQARLIATNQDGEGTAGPEGFQTQILPATIVKQSASTTVSEATMAATITTGNAATKYRFEYGPTAAYGKSTVEKTAKGSVSPSAVSTTVGGLTPGATYHFRVLIENSEGTDQGDDGTFTLQTPPSADACPNAAIRAEQNSQHLPECRAYEMVSPLEKNGADIGHFDGTIRASLSGDSVSFMSTGGFDSSGTGQAGFSTYVYDRSVKGWDGENINVYQDSDYRNGVLPGSDNLYPALSEDLSHGVLYAREPFPDSAANTPGIRNIFIWDRATGTYRVVTPNQSGDPVPPSLLEAPIFAGATPSFDHVVFNARLNLVPGATGPLPKAYHWHDGTLELAGILPGSSADPSTFSVIGSGSSGDFGGTGGDTGHAISVDGMKVFFTDVTNETSLCGGHGSCRGPLYLRKGGEETILVNEDENPAEDVPLGQAQFMLATPDGSAVFFTSKQRLVEADQDTEDALGADLYRYDTTVPPGASNLTLISDSPELPAPGLDSGTGGVLGVLGASVDGSRVYFAYMTDRGESQRKEVELWAYDEGQLRKVADLWGPPGLPGSDAFDFELANAMADEANWERGVVGATATVTPDGGQLLFMSARQQPDAFDNAGTAQMYLYDAERGSTTCVSCNPGSDHANWSAVVKPYNVYFGLNYPARTLSADGSTVFFHTREKLVARDANDRLDAYAYDVASGRLSLLSAGTGSDRSFFMGASADGETAFILTRDPLVAADRDNLRDLYAVRVNGGFPDPVTPISCGGDGCQAAATRAPEVPRLGSASYRGPAKTSRGHNCLVPRKKAAKAKRRLVRAEGKEQKAKARQALRKARARACRKGVGS